MLAHRLLGGCSSSLSISCASLVSALIAAAHSRLWSSFRRCCESPLLAQPETMVSCFLGSSRLFPGLPPGSLWFTSLFRLCSHSQPRSSPWDLTSEARASAPSPNPSRRVSRQASQAGDCCSALILCAGISPLCPLHPCCCALLRGPEASTPPPPISASEGASYCVETFPPSQLPPRGAGPVPILLSFFLFSFALPRYVGSFLPFGKSEVFCQCSVHVL